jgi:hypothetical protein
MNFVTEYFHGSALKIVELLRTFKSLEEEAPNAGHSVIPRPTGPYEKE